MTHQEIDRALQDYVLGLLPPARAAEVTAHLANCAACRETVRHERAIGELVHDTLAVQTRLDNAALQRRMPAIPAMRKSGIGSLGTRFAPALVVLFLLAGVILLGEPEIEQPLSLFSAPTATATVTQTPTATIAQRLAAPSPIVNTRGEPYGKMSEAAPLNAPQTADSTAPAMQPTPPGALEGTAHK